MPQRIIDDLGVIVWSAEYEPFGKAILTTTTIDNPLRFPGQYYDQESDKHYNFFRDYNPNTGRYVQSDPIGLFGGVNTE